MCSVWDAHRVITFSLINIVLGLLNLVRMHDILYKHFTTQVMIQIPYINNCSLHMGFGELSSVFTSIDRWLYRPLLKGTVHFT